MTEMNLKKTPLCDEHIALGAKMVPFAGWLMPVQYQGVIPEHTAVRNGVGIFDVSHMGEVWVEGRDAFNLLDYLTCNRVASLYDGKAQYTALLNDKGGVVDDIIIYRFNAERYLVCVNASNIEKDFDWISSHNKFDCRVTNESSEWSQVAIQGPTALALLAKIFSISEIKPFHFIETEFNRQRVIIARTGYSGEDGVEIFVKNSEVVELWRACLKAGASPCGLGARDTLRLEASYPLYGHELRDDWLALESGLGWIYKADKGEFLGKAPLDEAKLQGLEWTVAGIILEEPGIARDGSVVFDLSGAEIGVVTSGTKTPTLNRSIAMVRIKVANSAQDTVVEVLVRDKRLKARVVKLPFYRRSK